MKRIIAVLLTLVSIAACQVSVCAAGIPSAVKSSVKSIVSVNSVNSFGSREAVGFVAGKKGDYVLTGLDSVDGSKGEITVSRDGEKAAAKILAADKAMNVALLKLVDEETIKGTKPAVFYNADKPIDTEVYLLNRASLSDADSINSGKITDSYTVSSANSKDTVDVYGITVAVTEAESGAMLTDKHGNLIGVCLYDGNTSEDKAVQCDEICSLLDENYVSYRKATILIPILIAVVLAVLAAGLICMLVKRYREKQADRPMLEAVGGELAGQKIAITAESISIGRDPKCCQLVVLKDPKVSRCHCSIKYDNNKKKFVLTDLSSTHGTFLNNGKKLEPNVPTFISSSEMFRLGDNHTVFKVSEGGIG